MRKSALIIAAVMVSQVVVSIAHAEGREVKVLERMDVSIGYSELAVVHDDSRSVTCWINKNGNSGGISCIPDWMLSSDAKCLVKDVGRSQACRELLKHKVGGAE